MLIATLQWVKLFWGFYFTVSNNLVEALIIRMMQRGSITIRNGLLFYNGLVNKFDLVRC